MAMFKKCPRDSKLLLLEEWREWRLASVDELKQHLSEIKKTGILDSADTSRLLDGCVKENFRCLKQYSPNLKHMLLLKTSVSRQFPDGPCNSQMYAEVTRQLPDDPCNSQMYAEVTRQLPDDSCNSQMYAEVTRQLPDDPCNSQMYAQVKLTAQGRKAAILLSCEDNITEVICFVLQDMVRKLLDSGKRQEELDRLTESLNEKFGNGGTVLHYATDQLVNPKHATEIAILIKDFKCGIDFITAEDKYGRTALHFAAFRGNTDLCKFLIEKCEMGANAADVNKENVLHFAVNGDRLEVVQYLCGLTGAQDIICSEDAQKRTALHKAAAHGRREMIENLLSKISNPTDKGAYIRKTDLVGRTALLEAVRGGHEETVSCLLSNGSNPLRERDFDGKSALHYAVQLSEDEKAKRFVHKLLEHDDKSKSQERSLLLWASAAGIGTAEEYRKTKRQEHFGRAPDDGVEKILREKRTCSAERLEDLFITAIEFPEKNIARELVKRGVNAARLSKRNLSPQNKQRVDEVLRDIEMDHKMPERGHDQPAFYDSLGRNEFAEGLATLFLNPNVKSPLTVGISGDWGIGKSSLMVQTEIILLKTAAQLAFPNLLDAEKFPECTDVQQSRKGLETYEEINEAVKELKLLPSAVVSEDDPLVQFLNGDYHSDYHEVYKSLALIDRNEMIQRKGDDKGADSNNNRHSLKNIPSILTVRYNAWYYQSEKEAWAGLAVEITKAIEESMTRAQKVRCRWRYVRKEHGQKILFEFILPCLLALFFSSWVAWAVWKLLTRPNHKDLQDLKYGSVAATVLVVVWTVARQLFSVFQPINVQIRGYLQLPNHITNLGYQHQVISDINFMLDEIGEKPSWKWRCIAGLASLRGLNPDTVKGTRIPKLPPPCKDKIRMIVFVDDLDRCKDNVILQVLSAVNLVLAACNINVVLGMDVKMIARATESMFPDKKDNHEELAEKYISKIVQLPLALPDTSEDETKKFLNKQMGPPVFNPAFDSDFKTVTGERAGHEPSADSNRCCVYLDIPLTEEGQSSLRKVFLKFGSLLSWLINCICGCFTGLFGVSFCHRNPKGKLKTMLFNIETLTRNYSMEERIALEYLSSRATGGQRLPREWKRFLTYHRVAWHILHENRQLKNTLGWEAQLVIWLFCCSQWKRQINDVIKNWKKFVFGPKPSLKTIVEDYYTKIWMPLHHIEEEEEEDDDVQNKEEEEDDDVRNKEQPKKNQDKLMKTEDEKNRENEEKLKQEEEKEEWLSLIDTLDVNKYDVSKDCILYFQKFRLHCNIGHLS